MLFMPFDLFGSYLNGKRQAEADNWRDVRESDNHEAATTKNYGATLANQAAERTLDGRVDATNWGNQITVNNAQVANQRHSGNMALADAGNQYNLARASISTDLLPQWEQTERQAKSNALTNAELAAVAQGQYMQDNRQGIQDAEYRRQQANYAQGVAGTVDKANAASQSLARSGAQTPADNGVALGQTDNAAAGGKLQAQTIANNQNAAMLDQQRLATFDSALKSGDLHVAGAMLSLLHPGAALVNGGVSINGQFIPGAQFRDALLTRINNGMQVDGKGRVTTKPAEETAAKPTANPVMGTPAAKPQVAQAAPVQPAVKPPVPAPAPSLDQVAARIQWLESTVDGQPPTAAQLNEAAQLRRTLAVRGVQLNF